MGLCQRSSSRIEGQPPMLVTSSRKPSRVNRAKCSAEAGAVGDAVSMRIVLAGLLREIDAGFLFSDHFSGIC
eukprot:3242516-Pyramimonas_sp.AAC.1